MKRGLIAILLCSSLIFPVPGFAATAKEDAYRDALLRLVLLLQQQLAALTAERNGQVSTVTGSLSSDEKDTPSADVRGISVERPRTVDPSGIYESEFYDGRYVALYRVDGDGLTLTHGYADDLHEWIFSTLRTVTGRPFLAEYIAEFRIYYDEDVSVDAFVDQIDASNRWIIGVNLFSIEGYDGDTRAFLRELFIHEVAHIIIHNEPDVRDVFFSRFWDDADDRHARRVERSGDPQDIVHSYYEEHSADFVTEYAATSPLEDMAESFTYYVLKGTHGLSGEALKKVRFLEEQATFSAAKQAITGRF